MAEVRREIRGIPLWLIQEYLQEVGGRAVSAGYLQGPGCTGRSTWRKGGALSARSPGVRPNETGRRNAVAIGQCLVGTGKCAHSIALGKDAAAVAPQPRVEVTGVGDDG